MATDSVVIEDVISMPGAISKVTTELIGPFLMDVTLPERMLRALIFIVGVIISIACKAPLRSENDQVSGLWRITDTDNVNADA